MRNYEILTTGTDSKKMLRSEMHTHAAASASEALAKHIKKFDYQYLHTASITRINRSSTNEMPVQADEQMEADGIMLANIECSNS
ncbi:MAG: hypothetical protein JNL32_02345 [Candidatus Kapabacteria bacterium]|nr:hypothetical protein [Candidatus Kapabacteria bacterium]